MPIAAALPYIAAAAAAGGAVYSARQTSKATDKAIEAQRTIAENLKYEPIDIEQLKIDAQNNAIANATASLAIERKLTPDVSATREELARQIRADLERGGKLPTDVANQVTMAGRTIGARSGGGAGVTTPLTASLIGLSSVDLINQNQRDAQQFLGENDLPIAGLDPGQVAGLEVAQNAAQNQFNQRKAGVDSSLAQSELAARASQIGSTAGLISSVGGLLGQIGGAYQASRAGIGEKTTYDDFVKLYGKPQQPTYSPVDTTFRFT